MLMMRNSGRQLRWLLAIGKTAAGCGSAPPEAHSVAGQESDGLRRSASNVESRTQTAAFPLAAQNISHYTISLVDVRDSLDATAASNRLYKEGLEVWSGWLGACCSGSGSNFWHDKNCHSVENSGHAVQARKGARRPHHEDDSQHCSRSHSPEQRCSRL